MPVNPETERERSTCGRTNECNSAFPAKYKVYRWKVLKNCYSAKLCYCCRRVENVERSIIYDYKTNGCNVAKAGRQSVIPRLPLKDGYFIIEDGKQALWGN